MTNKRWCAYCGRVAQHCTCAAENSALRLFLARRPLDYTPCWRSHPYVRGVPPQIKRRERAILRRNHGAWYTLLVERYGERCAHCGRRPETLVIDHVLPLAKGGLSTPDNLQLLCAECNRLKGKLWMDCRAGYCHPPDAALQSDLNSARNLRSSMKPLSRITSDIYQLQLPLPFALNIVNVYLLRGPAGWTIVDTGLNTSESQETWRGAFNELGIVPGDIEQIVLTHTHPDHFGMAGWLQGLAEQGGRSVPVIASPEENRQAQIIWHQGTDFDMARWLQNSGMPPSMAREVQASTEDTRSKTRPHPRSLMLHTAGMPLRMGERTFQTIHAPGHSDGQLLFYDETERLLLSGDHVLMKITPNIGLWGYSETDPLGNFLDSLRELASLDVRLALPGHKRLIEDWGGRISELLAHHNTRLAHVMDAVQVGLRTPYEVAGRIFPTERFSVHEWRFAVAETLSHLEYLRLRGQISETGEMRHYTLA